MKYIYSLIISFALITTANAKTYTIHFDKTGYDISVRDGVVHIEKKDGFAFFDDDPKGPALPYSIYRILRPLNSSSTDYKVTFKTTSILENVKIEANPQMKSTNSTFDTKESASLLASKSQICPVKLLGDMSIYGFSYASFWITPFLFNKDIGQLLFVTEVNIILPDSTKAASLQSINSRRPEISFLSTVKDAVINPKELEDIYSDYLCTLRDSPKSVKSNDDIEYLIITPQELSSSFRKLMEWKNKKGVKADLKTTNYIGTLYPSLWETNKPLAIKNFLYDYYQTHGVKWVLLGGDFNKVASRICKIEAYFNGANHASTTPCDYYYSCFGETFNWDANGNGIYGEISDNVDLSPYIYVSRVPVNDTVQANNFVDKVLSYEKTVPTSGYINKMLLTGSWDPNDDSDRSQYWGYSRAHSVSEGIYASFSTYWVNYRDYQYDTACSPSPYNLTNLIGWLNSGYHFVHMCCHGDSLGWSIYGADGNHGSDFQINSVNSLTNANPMIILTTACYTSNFDSNNCLGEAFIRNPNGAVIYVGSSRDGLNKGRLIQLSDAYSAKFFKKLFTDMPSTAPHRLGSIMADTKIDFIDLCNSSTNGYRWLQFAINPFGDPEMPIYTGYWANVFYPSFTFSGSDITVSVGNFDGVTISMEKADGTYEVAKNVTNSHTFHNISSLVKFTITKDGFKAYESGDMYPTGNIFIAGPTLICDSALYSVVNLPSNAKVSWTNGLFSLTSRPNYPLNSQCMLINDHYNQFANPQFAGIYATISIPGIENYILSKDIRISGWRYVSYTQYANGSYPYVSNTQASLNAPNYINPGCEIFLFSDNFKLMNITHSGVTPSTWSFNNNNSYLTFTLPNSSVGQTFTIHVRANKGEGDCNDFDISFIATTNSLNSQSSPQIEIRAAERGNYIRMASLDENSIWNLKVYNALAGESVINTEVQGASKFIDTSSWKPGVYIVRCQVGDKVVTEKMTVKQ